MRPRLASSRVTASTISGPSCLSRTPASSEPSASSSTAALVTPSRSAGLLGRRSEGLRGMGGVVSGFDGNPTVQELRGPFGVLLDEVGDLLAHLVGLDLLFADLDAGHGGLGLVGLAD